MIRIFATRFGPGLVRPLTFSVLRIPVYKNSISGSLVASTPGLCQQLSRLPNRWFRPCSTLPPHRFINLPNLSPTMEAGNIQSWAKQEGDKLEEGDVLCQIETDKAVMGMETPFQGFLAKIIHPAGTKNIPTNQPIAIVVKRKEEVDAFKNYVHAQSKKSGKPAETVPGPEKEKVVEKAMHPDIQQNLQGHQSSSQKQPDSTKTFASPYAKKLAKESNIDLTTIKGSGPHGRVVAADITTQKPQAAPRQVQTVSHENYVDIELTLMRSTISKRLLMSKTTIPHFHITSEIYMDNLLAFRKELNESFKGKIKLSINDFIIKASSLALVRVPECNSQWMDTFIRQFKNVDISVGVATEAGLITPIVFDASSKSISRISEEVKVLAEKARTNKLTLPEFQGGTFTVSNLGMYGVSEFTAIINPPQVCILSIGSPQRVYVKEGDSEPCFKSVMKVTLGCDHRVVDGAIGARWLSEFKSLMENPLTMLV
ncbi:Dihydrolipoyllysine-residue acetyltransferase component of pyruvate dehydrogenase complex, mitochondrial [Thelohanellus kitauei]|uniref:Acetyltransferase component of pyruvate dehydrogenase complex n=1 Tax=Thelohanellus kitauei TaxID=669202 RepID=A0A0C2MSZ9_THEKT|nr:Dihydrolipoyllysine-residue acetyltransferase component of pyruvate dehydrogenase complex, mitochondrial [Thelohanellus kitauei]